MSLRSLLRPRRALAFPFVAVLYPLLWFIVRDADVTTAYGVSGVVPRTLGFVTGAVVVSYVVAVVVVEVVEGDSDSASTWKRWLFAPSNRALALFAVVSLLLWIQLLDVTTTPVWLRDVERLLGVAVGWPLMAAYLVGFGLSVLFRGSLGVQFAAVAVGVSLSVAWLFVLFGWFADAVSRSLGTDSPTGR
ncbi:hypothetical protein [Haladaptatus sp. DYF46]|uniref:hypothetical protein n=1 Tax=Haladaptatus sp. DYF46 TaxID=2886041 RepID=UPI001E5D111E|nr:hypothetical protein [Haladaptatus sp. DYF46]